MKHAYHADMETEFRCKLLHVSYLVHTIGAPCRKIVQHGYIMLAEYTAVNGLARKRGG